MSFGYAMKGAITAICSLIIAGLALALLVGGVTLTGVGFSRSESDMWIPGIIMIGMSIVLFIIVIRYWVKEGFCDRRMFD